MEQRVVNISERSASTTVNGVDHIESISLNGIGLLKFYFQHGADTGLAISQLVSVSEAIKNILPPGINPPSVIDYNATEVPISYLLLSSEYSAAEQSLRLRLQLRAHIPVHHSRTVDAGAVRRRVAAGDGEYRSVADVRARRLAQRRRQRAAEAERDHSRRHRENRQHRVRRGDQRQPAACPKI